MTSPPTRNFARRFIGWPPFRGPPPAGSGVGRRARAAGGRGGASSPGAPPRRGRRRRGHSPSGRASSACLRHPRVLEARELHAAEEEVEKEKGEGDPVHEQRGRDGPGDGGGLRSEN